MRLSCPNTQTVNHAYNSENRNKEAKRTEVMGFLLSIFVGELDDYGGADGQSAFASTQRITQSEGEDAILTAWFSGSR